MEENTNTQKKCNKKKMSTPLKRGDEIGNYSKPKET